MALFRLRKSVALWICPELSAKPLRLQIKSAYPDANAGTNHPVSYTHLDVYKRQVPDALLTKRLDFKARAKAQLAASLVSGGVAVTMALRGMGVWSLVAQALCAAGLRSVMLWQFSRWWPKGHFSRVAFRRLFAFGGFMLLSGLLNTVSIRIQTLVIGRLFDAGTLGYYTLAQGASGVPASLMDAVLSLSLIHI